MKVLIAYDGSSHADDALENLFRAGLPREVEALIVTIGDVSMAPAAASRKVVGTFVTPQSATAIIALGQARVSQALEAAQGLAMEASRRIRALFPGWVVRAEAWVGLPDRELIPKAEQWGADLIIVGSQGRSASGRSYLGNVAKKVAIEAPCSVRVVRASPGKDDPSPPRIMVAVDGSPEAERAVRAIGERVWPDGTEVRIITVDDRLSTARIAGLLPTATAMIIDGNEEAAAQAQQMVEWAARELGEIGLNVSVAIEEGEAQRVLVEEAWGWNADCIFVGPRRFSSSFERLRLGSVSAGVVSNAHCSVEVVR
jgi:nucleotide-binding universal stress UspA family protein